jgi:hypothetical protein
MLYAQKHDEYYTITLLNEEIKLASINVNNEAVSNGSRISMVDKASLSIKATASGHQGLTYKIVQEIDGRREIVAYGSEKGNSLKVAPPGRGEYTVYIWAQKDGVAIKEGSVPIYFSLSVLSDTPAQGGRRDATTPVAQTDIDKPGSSSMILDNGNSVFDIRVFGVRIFNIGVIIIIASVAAALCILTTTVKKRQASYTKD